MCVWQWKLHVSWYLVWVEKLVLAFAFSSEGSGVDSLLLRSRWGRCDHTGSPGTGWPHSPAPRCEPVSRGRSSCSTPANPHTAQCLLVPSVSPGCPPHLSSPPLFIALHFELCLVNSRRGGDTTAKQASGLVNTPQSVSAAAWSCWSWNTCHRKKTRPSLFFFSNSDLAPAVWLTSCSTWAVCSGAKPPGFLCEKQQKQ